MNGDDFLGAAVLSVLAAGSSALEDVLRNRPPGASDGATFAGACFTGMSGGAPGGGSKGPRRPQPERQAAATMQATMQSRECTGLSVVSPPSRSTSRAGRPAGGGFRLFRRKASEPGVRLGSDVRRRCAAVARATCYGFFDGEDVEDVRLKTGFDRAELVER